MIKRFEGFDEPKLEEKGYTLGDLRKLTEGLPDDTPVLYVNPVDRGDNMSDPFQVEDSLLGSDGYYHKNSHLTDSDSKKKLSLIIYSL